MKMRSISTLLVKGIVLVSFIYAGSVSPMISMRFSDVVTNTIPTPSTILGLQIEVGDGVYAGVDSDIATGDSRLFVNFSYGTFGMGTNGDGEPQFTIGGHYSLINNFKVSLDYVINQLTDDGAGAPDPNQLRVSLGVNF